jgi:preprotein translocase subunit Sec63
VILLEKSNEWNLSPSKEGSSKKKKKREREKEREKKKKKEQGLKSKRGETSYEEAPYFKRRKKSRMKFSSY